MVLNSNYRSPQKDFYHGYYLYCLKCKVSWCTSSALMGDRTHRVIRSLHGHQCTHASHIFPKRDKMWEYFVLHVCILYGITMLKKLDGIRSYYCSMATQPVYCSTLVALCTYLSLCFRAREISKQGRVHTYKSLCIS